MDQRLKASNDISVIKSLLHQFLDPNAQLITVSIIMEKWHWKVKAAEAEN